MAYDSVGNRTLKHDARDVRVSMTYDVDDRLIRETYADTAPHTYAYAAAGNRTLMSDATGRYTTVYDIRDSVLSVTNPDSKQVRYTHDALTRRTLMTDPDGGRFTYSYDATDRLILLENPQQKTTSFAYDVLDRQVRREVASGTTTTQIYDPAGRLTGLWHTESGGTVLSSFTYTYDDAGNRRTALEDDADRVTWTYDETNQLLAEHRSGNGAYHATFTYDPVGNRTLLDDVDDGRTTYTYDPANELTVEQSPTQRTTYTYDAVGNRTEKDGSSTTYYTWDADNRLIEAEPVAGAVTFTYNAVGKRVGKETSGDTKKFIYDFENLLQETDAGDTVQNEYTGTVEEYGDLVSEYDGTDSHYHHYDALGSTDALVDPAQPSTDRWIYRAFGAIESATDPDATPFGFVGRQGYYHDPEIDLCFVRARYYDPATGQFTSPDPKGVDADENLYRYVGNAPTNATDPTGLVAPPKSAGQASARAKALEKLLHEEPRVLEHLKKVAKDTTGPERFGVIMKATDPAKKPEYEFLELQSKAATSTRSAFKWWGKKGQKAYGAKMVMSKPGNLNQKVSVDTKIGSPLVLDPDYLIEHSWHTHPHWGDAWSSTGDGIYASTNNIVDLQLTYIQRILGGKFQDDWFIWITDTDGKAYEYEPKPK